MRRTLLAGLALATTLGLAPALAAQQPQAPATQQGEHAARSPRWGRGEHRFGHGPFRGIELSQAQKEQVKAIHERYAAQFRTLREQFRPVAQELRAARQKGDTAAVKAARERVRPQMEQMRALRQKEFQEVRGVLTPEQQKRLDQNRSELKARMEHRRSEHRAHRARAAESRS
ncbi:MAG: Spy/CpxP family protein refolding chaperone [Gemmatimonadetes bacterium]|nr:Spy/CpxP family protein refolding chaperone [Gemmatimonadota bacterium]